MGGSRVFQIIKSFDIRVRLMSQLVNPSIRESFSPRLASSVLADASRDS